jgi:outer membrane receptor protein involved in Fe transport
VGGLFEDADDNAGIVYWDGNLVNTDIHNIDLRWELFAKNGQFFSLSGFYKKFFKPIEMVQYFTQVGAFQPRNVGDGEVFGAEAEARFSFNFITEQLRNFGFVINFTFTESRVELSATEYQSRVDNVRLGETIDDYRDMAGQAPYIINAGLAYNGGEKGFGRGLEAGLYYNVQGQTLTFVGIADRPNIYTEPFHSLNFNSNKKFGKNDQYRIGFKIDNLLNDDVEVIFKSYEAENQYFTRLKPGMKFKLRFSFNF